MVYARHWGMRIFTLLKGNFVGCDQEGNQYYQERFWGKVPERSPRRWVIYRGIMEASRVPAEWFGWLRYMSDTPLEDHTKKSWQKSHQSNMTGTTLAYHPQGHELTKNEESIVFQGYHSWKPD